MDFSSVMASPSYDKAAETYKKAVAAAATMTAYTVLARSMPRELFRNELRAAARWAASVARGRLLPRPKARRTKTIFIPRFAAADGASHGHHGGESSLYSDARAYLATRIDPCAMAQFGKAWKRGNLLHGPPGTGKSSLVAAMANYLRFNLYDLDLSQVYSNLILQKLLMATPNKSILVIEDIDCCFSATSREGAGAQSVEVQTKNGNGNGDCSESSDAATSRTSHRKNAIQGLQPQAERGQGITLSGLLSFIDGLWSTSGEERIIVFTTNYKDRLDPALLRPGRMDMHIYMGYCCWEAFKTLAKNYFLVDDHPLFPEIQDLLAEVEVTPATVSEMLLRSEDAGVALHGFVEFLQDMKKQGDGKQ